MVGLGQTRLQRIARDDYILKRRAWRIDKRPIADILIGAFATRFDGLLTRNTKHFRSFFPDLRLEGP